MSLPVRLGLLALLLAALVGFAIFVQQGTARGESPGSGAGANPGTTAARTRFQSSAECAQCHRAIWNEWHGSHHQIAYLNPEVRQLSDDFRNKECQACHLPRPVAVTGYAKRTLHRTTLPDEGVSCLTCHLGRNGEILGRTAMPDAPCNPIASAEMTSVAMCESCHNQHKTTDQWRQTTYFEAGTDCNSCHMPEVARAKGRRGRSHVFSGSHDIEILRSALRFAARVDDTELVIEVENIGAGHNFPTEERSRASDVVVRFDEDSEWQQVHRFRFPYRSEPLPDTTLPHGSTEKMSVQIPTSSRQAQVRLWYRLTPYVGDEDPRSGLLFEQHIDLSGQAPVIRPVTQPPLPAVSAFRPPEDPAEIPAEIPTVTGAGDSRPTGIDPQSLPPLELESKLDRFRELADLASSARPDEEHMKLVRSQIETALGPRSGSPMRATRALRDLRRDADSFWGLEDALTHENHDVRRGAALELGRLDNPASLAPLVLRLKYEVDSPRVQATIANALTLLGNRSGLPELIRMLSSDETVTQAGTRSAAPIAVEICRRAGEDAGASPTPQELSKRLQRLYLQWREELQRREEEPAAVTDPLLRARIARHLLELEAFQLRGVDEARFTLARLGNAATPLLREALRATEPYLRTHALEILRNMKSMGRNAAPDVLPLLGDELTRVDAARALGLIGAVDAIPALELCLDAGDPELRATGAQALGRLAATRSIAKLEAIFADAMQPLDVRVHAAFSLALLTPTAPARTWLEDLQKRDGYHASTLQELLEEIAFHHRKMGEK